MPVVTCKYNVHELAAMLCFFLSLHGCTFTVTGIRSRHCCFCPDRLFKQGFFTDAPDSYCNDKKRVWHEEERFLQRCISRWITCDLSMF